MTLFVTSGNMVCFKEKSHPVAVQRKKHLWWRVGFIFPLQNWFAYVGIHARTLQEM